MKRLTFVCFLLFGPALLAQQEGSGSAGYVIRTDAQEVVVDLIVRDKDGEAVRDLTADDVTVAEDGVKQEVVSFRKVEGGQLERLGGTAQEALPGGIAVGGGPGGSMRMAQLVTLVFERLGNTGRNLAFRAARDLIRSELQDNVYFAVYVLDRNLLPIQEFTNDRDKLEEAIETATGRNRTDFYTEAALVQERLQGILRASGAPNLQQANAQSSLVAPQGPPDIDLMLTQRAFAIAERSEQLSRDAEAGGSIFSLIALVRAFEGLAGRKTVVLFSEGFQVPVNFTSHLDSMVSEANLGQVSFYTVDARGLETGSQLDAARDQLQRAASSSRSQQELATSSEQRGFRQDEIQALDNAQSSIRGNRQGTLGEIASRTGGEFIGNTNNFSKPILRLTEDIFSYYEVSYRPRETNFDGSFRAVSVAVNRPDVQVQTRDGYYAFQPTAADIVSVPFETPLLSQLALDEPVRDIASDNAFWKFRSPSGTPLLSLGSRLPLSELEFTTRQVEVVDDQSKRKKKKEPEMKEVYDARFSILAQLKTAAGVVVKKTSQDVPLSGDAERLPALRQANFRLFKTWEVDPGEYAYEVALHDQTAGKFGTYSAGLVIDEPADGIAVSSLVLIERVDPKPELKKGEEPPPAPPIPNPLEFHLGTVVPAATSTISKAAGGSVSYYFVIYPERGSADAPTLSMEYYLAGQLVGQGAPELPAAAEDGTIPYIATTPASAFPPGQYRMLITVEQGGKSAQSEALFEIVD